MPLVANHHDFTLPLAHAANFKVHLGHQRAGCIKDLETALFRLAPYGLRHPMGTENHRISCGNLTQFLNKHCPFAAQIIADEFVVHHLMPHVDRRPEFFQGALHNGDGAFDASTETARVGKNDWHGFESQKKKRSRCRNRF